MRETSCTAKSAAVQHSLSAARQAAQHLPGTHQASRHRRLFPGVKQEYRDQQTLMLVKFAFKSKLAGKNLDEVLVERLEGRRAND